MSVRVYVYVYVCFYFVGGQKRHDDEKKLNLHFHAKL